MNSTHPMHAYQVMVDWIGRRGEALGPILTTVFAEDQSRAHDLAWDWRDAYLHDLFHGRFVNMSVAELTEHDYPIATDTYTGMMACWAHGG